MRWVRGGSPNDNFARYQLARRKLGPEDADFLALLDMAQIHGLVAVLVLGLVVQRDVNRARSRFQFQFAGGDGNYFADGRLAFVKAGVMGAGQRRHQHRNGQNNREQISLHMR